MIIVKYTFLFFIFLGVSLIGSLIAKKYKSRVKELKDFKEICNILESKIKFTYEPLGEILEETSELMHENRMSKVLEHARLDLRENNFKVAWEKGIDSQKNLLNLKEEDIGIIKGLGNMLGKTDIQGQLSEIELTMDFLDTQIKDAENECKKNEKMYRTLGTIVGLAIVIILI